MPPQTEASASSSPPPNQRDPYAAFRVSVYRFYTLGWVVSLIGMRIQATAVSWDMYQRTGEALSLGLVGLAQAVPVMLFAIPAGYLADKFNRARLMMISLLATVFTSLALAVLSYTHGSAGWIYVLLFLDATAVMIGRPARSALIPQLVPVHVFPNAVTWNTSILQIASVAGPALGGVVIVWSVSASYIIAACCSIFFLVLLAWLNVQAAPKKSTGAASFRTLLAGIEYVWEKRIIFILISLDLFAVLLGGAVYLLPIFAKDILKVGATGFGWLRAAPAVGAFCMALLLLYLPPMKRAGWSLLLSVAGFGVATIIFGLAKSFWVAFFMLFLTGAFDNVSVVIRQTLTQVLTPDHMRGRVSAVSSVFIGASNELGGLESGLTAYWFGPVLSVVGGGIGTLLVVLVTGLVSPQLRALGGLHDAKIPEEPVKAENAPAEGLAPEAS